MGNLLRMWINQPSKMSDDKEYHGKNVLVCEKEFNSDEKSIRVWFVSGDVHSVMVSRLSLSKGWEKTSTGSEVEIEDGKIIVTQIYTVDETGKSNPNKPIWKTRQYYKHDGEIISDRILV